MELRGVVFWLWVSGDGSELEVGCVRVVSGGAVAGECVMLVDGGEDREASPLAKTAHPSEPN